MIRIEEYVAEGSSPFRRWSDGLDVQAAAGVTVAIERLAGQHLERQADR
ncbi:hypothetical protein ACFIOY_07410 [Bradyrhizobium sp. TZ2]